MAPLANGGGGDEGEKPGVAPPPGRQKGAEAHRPSKSRSLYTKAKRPAAMTHRCLAESLLPPPPPPQCPRYYKHRPLPVASLMGRRAAW